MCETDYTFDYATPSNGGAVIDTDAEYLSPSDYDVLQDLIAQAGAIITSNQEDY